MKAYAEVGLRTLLLARKEVTLDEYEAWNQKVSESLQNNESQDKLESLFEEIERGLELVGATAIEDKLQENVPETISFLKDAGIKVWVLTGDKMETAINIGFSTALLNDD